MARLFSAKGYAATRVREIMADGGVTKPVLKRASILAPQARANLAQAGRDYLLAKVTMERAVGTLAE